MAKSLGNFEPIFGKVNAEWDKPCSVALLPFMFHVHVFNATSIRIHVTDFHSYTFESIRSLSQLEDLKDDIGIGGNWSDFMDYLRASMNSDQVKLILDSPIHPVGHRDVPLAKFIAQKSKGMPVFSISLVGLVNSSASDAIANLSIGIFTAFQREHNLVIKEQTRAYQLTNLISAEQEKNEIIQKELDAVLNPKRRKAEISSPDKAFPFSDPLRNSDSVTLSEIISPAEKPFAKDSFTTKVSQRVVPAYRRAKVRGALVQDSDDEKDN
ncbi:uncharacterized protein LOC122647351 [Telopea speciosissima]|uniref:uncharacterized protein LOC122647351 n=1 Tax=Telopea speciosissima TaxID=54955 RepID=UPI001CC5A82F|nr:uncharacterized protein LOC122647351 [Telopea speciosissima]XP_043696719.1 uncharacterized protein LOC122647351 [Telopea speciosissima]